MNNSVIGNIEEMLKDYEHGLYDFTKNGKCSECGGCCSDLLPMTTKEINTIRRYIEKHHIQKQLHGTNVLAKPTYDCQCPFLDLTKSKEKCLIYEVRPQICREFVCNNWTFKDKVRVANMPVNVVSVSKTFYE